MEKEIKIQKNIHLFLFLGQLLPLLFITDKFVEYSNLLLIVTSVISILLPAMGLIYYKIRTQAFKNKIELLPLKELRINFLLRLLSVQLPLLLSVVSFTLTNNYLFFVHIIILSIVYWLLYPKSSKINNLENNQLTETDIVTSENKDKKAQNTFLIIFSITMGLFGIFVSIVADKDIFKPKNEFSTGRIQNNTYINESLGMKMVLPQGYRTADPKYSKYFAESITLINIHYPKCDFRCMVDKREGNKSLNNDSIYVAVYEEGLKYVNKYGGVVERILDSTVVLFGDTFNYKVQLLYRDLGIENTLIYKIFKNYVLTCQLTYSKDDDIHKILLENFRNCGMNTSKF